MTYTPAGTADFFASIGYPPALAYAVIALEIAGGALMGMGLLILFRHRTGLGGINIVAIYLQERCGIRAGYFQLGVDLAILTAAAFVLPPANLALSIIGATVVNLMLAINHKPGRYVGVT